MPLTLASLPPELYPTIISHVGTNDGGRISSSTDRRRSLMPCSLVCVYWANECRKFMWDYATVYIQTLADLLALESFSEQESPRLVYLVQLAHTLNLRQDWDSPAWCHRFFNSPLRSLVTQGQLFTAMTICGPLPSHLPRAALHSPLWTLPRSMPHVFLSFTTLELTNVHFPCLSDLYIVVGRFKSMASFHALGVTWDVSDVHLSLPHQLDDSFRLESWNLTASDCTNNVLLCALASRDMVPSFGVFLRMREELQTYLLLLTAIAPVGGDGCAARQGGYIEMEYESFSDSSPSNQTEGKLYAHSHTSQKGFIERDDELSIVTAVHISCWHTPFSLDIHSLCLVILEVNSSYVIRNQEDLDEQWQFMPEIIQLFHSRLSLHPTLRSVELFASLHLLQHVVRLSPEIAQVPSFDTEPRYIWTCPLADFAHLAGEYEFNGEGRKVVVDPLTLGPSERYHPRSTASAVAKHATRL